jgi:hypothetical protein
MDRGRISAPSAFYLTKIELLFPARLCGIGELDAYSGSASSRNPGLVASREDTPAGCVAGFEDVSSIFTLFVCGL